MRNKADLLANACKFSFQKAYALNFGKKIQKNKHKFKKFRLNL